MTVPLRTSWWTRRRLTAAVVLWLMLPLVYVFAEGPIFFAAHFSETVDRLWRVSYPQAYIEFLAACPPLETARSAWLNAWGGELPYFRTYYFEFGRDDGPAPEPDAER